MSTAAQRPDLPVMGIRVAAEVIIAVPSRIDLLTPYVLLEQENWFEDEIVFLAGCIGEGARVVDIGANYGSYSLSLARAAGPSGRVWSVEPASQTAAYLRKSIEINGFENVTVIQKALSNKAGTARLSVEANSELNSIAQGGSGASEEVPLDTLDALAAEHGWTGIDFLKLDAEGEEERILEGATVFLREANPLVMFEIKHGGRLHLQLVEKFRAAGFEPYLLVPGLGLLSPFDVSQAVDLFRLNLFACKPERAAMLERQGVLTRAAAPVPKADPFDHFRAAHEKKNAAGVRLAHLKAAYSGLAQLSVSRADAWTLSSCARVARELGLRLRAVELMNEALTLALQDARATLPARYLAPVPAFDAIDPGSRPKEWLEAALLDGLIELSSFSTYYARGTHLQQPTLDRLEALKSSGFMRAPMERRRQLLRVGCGLQPGPVPDPLLAEDRPDNLNPGLWVPAAAGAA